MLNFQTLFESIPGLYIVYSLDFMIVAGSDAYFRATKTKREQVVGRPFFEVFSDNPDDPNANSVQNLRASLSNVIKHRLPHTMAVQKYDIPCNANASAALLMHRFTMPMRRSHC
ncbi:MAG: PAS domain-containing protein [Nostoc sp.]|uniref:PAS domain-containing protein n=1 Tax=Nostoc sp. TaxID=1180 RepID=UPI002FFC7C74